MQTEEEEMRPHGAAGHSHTRPHTVTVIKFYYSKSPFFLPSDITHDFLLFSYVLGSAWDEDHTEAEKAAP
jgi:hypothetical protein